MLDAAPRHRATTERVRDAFAPTELAELTLTVAVAHGFSKAAIVWGPEPSLPTTTIPTPGS